MEPPTTDRPAGAGTPQPPPPPRPSGQARQLRRLPDRGPIAGVCAGIADYFNVDPVIVRIAAVVLLVTGPGAIAYLLAWVFVPAAEGGPASGAPATSGTDRGMQVLGIVLLVVAVSVLWGDWWGPGRRLFFPLALIALGLWLLLRRDDRSSTPPHGAGPGTDGPAGTPMPAWPAAPTSGSTGTTAAWSHSTPAATSGAAADASAADDDRPMGEDVTAAGWGDGDATAETAAASAGDGGTGGADPTTTYPWGGPPPAQPEPGRRRRRLLPPIVLGALLVWAGIAWLAGATLVTALAVALCIVGVGFVVGAFVGGSWALVAPAVLIGGALVVATVVDIPFNGPIGERTWRPETVAELEDDYELSMGEGTLDLTALDLSAGDELSIQGSIGIGHLVVEVPETISLQVDAEAGMGELFLLDVRNNGFGVEDRRSFDAGRRSPLVVLDLEVGIGQVEVVQVPVGRIERGS